MSTAAPAGAFLARTLDPHERERVNTLRRTRMRHLAVAVGFFLFTLLSLLLTVAHGEFVSLVERLALSFFVAVWGIGIWTMRHRAGRIATDIELGAVYRLEGTVQKKRRWYPSGRFGYVPWKGVHQLRMAGQWFDVVENQFSAVAEGSACSLELLPNSRLALSVNGIKRWP